MKTRVLYLIILLFSYRMGHAQQVLPDPITEIPIPYVDLISFDTRDQLFASTTSGDIYMFDSKGIEVNLYSPERQGRLSQLEASWTANIFSFSADLQEYRLFDRFLNPLSDKGFLLNDVSLAKAATLGNNNILWVWDESDMSLKILDYRRNLVLQNQPLNLILDNADELQVAEIREFKNRLFMNIPKDGIYLFDNQGNLIQKIKLKIDQRLCLYKEYLFWVQEDDLMVYSFSTQAIFKMAKLPNSNIKYLQMSQNRLALVEEDKIILYPLPFWIGNLK
ncbi:hypothetical protein [Algoriphagus sediminis]|uniref:Uncharacterized protein n=1 Tax=Algoriphagus sediminis TaxID=3057113 RepID=A0ABT7Y8S5_9BACT|nr:hypothetical protein [Algoriphagus sediminis]MDN3202871.1 hypothetical protein [Algoriphagus sediminis]